MLRVLAVSILLALAPFTLAADPKIAPWLADRLAGGARAEFLVVLASPGRPAADARVSPPELYARLVESTRTGHDALRRDLAAEGITARSFYLVDAVLVTGDLALATRLAGRADVVRVVANPRVRALAETGGSSSPLAPASVEWGVSMVRAPETWSTFGTRGEGVVVASMDTGVDWNHPALYQQYRGWNPETGSADHRWSWHDAVDDSPEPWDDDNHGTHTTGTMVGDDGAANQVGVAPGARWVACRNMDYGWGSPALYIECMEWTFAPYPPGGDPLTDGRPDLAPQIVNNSWYCPASEGCDWPTLREAFARLRQADIFEIGSAGNSGSSCSSVGDPPAIYDDLFTVGAVDSLRAMAGYSSRGPVLVDGSGRRKPDVAAPGSSVRSALRGGGYGLLSGTSMAAPHVAGVAALLWSARPEWAGLIDLSRCVIERSASNSVTNPTAQSCGGIPDTVFPNNVAGWGIADAFAALSLPRSDGDPAPDVCDCAPADGTVSASPREVSGLEFTGTNALAWDSQAASAGSSTRYDVVRGDVARLRSDGGIGAATCLAPDLPGSSTTDTFRPAPRTAVYYLVRATNSCGTGGWGSGSNGSPRVNAACD